MTPSADTDSLRRDADRRVIEDLNAHYIRAAEQGDVGWYEQHLADDFVTSSVDGSIVDRAAFLQRSAHCMHALAVAEIDRPRRGGRQHQHGWAGASSAGHASIPWKPASESAVIW